MDRQASALHWRENYRRDGFLLLRRFFPTPQLDALAALIKDIFATAHQLSGGLDDVLIAAFGKDRNLFKVCGLQAQHLPELYQLGTALAGVVRELGLTLPVFNTRPLLLFSSPHTAASQKYWKVEAHQDWHSAYGSLDSVTAWVPCVPVPPELGPLEVVPGSHLAGPLPVQLSADGAPILADAPGGFTSLPMETGDVLLFSTFLVHRSGTNQSGRVRLSAQFRFSNLHEPVYRERGYYRHFDETRRTALAFRPSMEQVRHALLS